MQIRRNQHQVLQGILVGGNGVVLGSENIGKVEGSRISGYPEHRPVVFPQDVGPKRHRVVQMRDPDRDETGQRQGSPCHTRRPAREVGPGSVRPLDFGHGSTR